MMNLTVYVWRQKDATSSGEFQKYTEECKGISEHMSFLEMLDVINERLTEKDKQPIAFDSDCREGICGTCSMVINGRPHGPMTATTACQLHMRSFKSGDVIYIEPWRAKAFPVLQDLIVDRDALDGIIQAGGYISTNCGSAPDANAILVGKEISDAAMDAAACIGCGACVAACPNSSAMLFTAAKLSHMNTLPQGKAEQTTRTLDMVNAMDAAGFGNCSNHLECEAACPKEISGDVIAAMNRGFAKASLLKG
jgi:succinate dehydrogenase / fumarate reductase iron-sulfur subunit